MTAFNNRRRTTNTSSSTRSSSSSQSGKPLTFEDTWSPRKATYTRHKIAGVVAAAGIVMILVCVPGSTGSLIGMVVLALAVAWFVFSSKMAASDIKLVRELSLAADTAGSAANHREEIVIEAMIRTGFIDKSTRPYSEDVWLKAIDLDVTDPWTFLLRERQKGRLTVAEVQKLLDITAPKVNNGKKDCEFVMVEPTMTSGHMFKVYFYFTEHKEANFEEGWDINAAMKRTPTNREDETSDEDDLFEQFDREFHYPFDEDGGVDA